ncbi:DNA helicase MCM9 isoform X3 [Sebastes fasciatus]|uniref:DNA helicase MCM9 isoform X3 n=1 Tax=Sebastes fasciatus TaxID=394691 RepID=UPI003D9F86B1
MWDTFCLSLVLSYAPVLPRFWNTSVITCAQSVVTSSACRLILTSSTPLSRWQPVLILRAVLHISSAVCLEDLSLLPAGTTRRSRYRSRCRGCQWAVFLVLWWWFWRMIWWTVVNLLLLLGDDVTVYGVMCQRWKPFYDGARCDVELALKANNMEVNNQQAAAALLLKDTQKEFEDFWTNYKHDPIAGRNQILLSLCPQVFGMYVIKLAVAMVLAGGVQRIDSSGTKIRGECHMLLVGDPGTGKSQFLKYAAKIMPRSVLTAGIGSTSAGLTVAAVKDGGDWHLEAGALVLSDGGLCCIDEFNSIKEHDRISIHEAMEQQSISVAKAGMVCKLNTRTSILAAANPKGQYDPNEPLSVNVALASPLLSRFDLVLVLLDTRNAEWDHTISSFILEDRGLPAESASLWSMEKMKAYFSVIKRLQPQLSDEANSILTRYYQLQRQSDGRNAARTTIRMLESLSRLAEAHARLMFRETVTIEDAVIAVSVMECSMQGGALLGNVNALLTSFPSDPGQQYQLQCQTLLEGLNLPLLLQKDMDRQVRLKSRASEASQLHPPTDHYQRQLRDPNSTNTTHRHDVTTVDSGLDWFHSITPSLSPDGMASSMTTAAQHTRNRKPNPSWSDMSPVSKQSHCQSEKDCLSNTGSSLNRGTIPFASEEDTRKSPKERWRDETQPKTLGCVFQKVSKNLRDRRRQLELNQQHGERVVSADSLDTTSSGEKLAQDNLSSGRDSRCGKEDKRDQTGTKNTSTELKEQMDTEAETGEELHAKLSGFIFKPRKMRASVHNQQLSSEIQTSSNPGSRDLHTHTLRPVRHEESADPLTDTEKNKRQNQYQRKKVSCDSGGGQSGSGVSMDQDGLARVDSATSIIDPAPSRSTVASSTLDKLSRFSFTCSTEPTTTPQTTVGNSPPNGVEERDGALNPPEHSPLVRKIQTVQDPELPRRREHQHWTESPTKTMSKSKAKHTEGTPAADQRNSVEMVNNLKKRKCFELGPPLSSVAGSRGPFSLFDSVAFSNDVLDTDWDQEVSKKAKM